MLCLFIPLIPNFGIFAKTIRISKNMSIPHVNFLEVDLYSKSKENIESLSIQRLKTYKSQMMNELLIWVETVRNIYK